MIRLLVENDIKEKQRILCPHCKQIIDLISVAHISEILGGYTLSISLYIDLLLDKVKRESLEANETKAKILEV